MNIPSPHAPASCQWLFDCRHTLFPERIDEYREKEPHNQDVLTHRVKKQANRHVIGAPIFVLKGINPLDLPSPPGSVERVGVRGARSIHAISRTLSCRNFVCRNFVDKKQKMDSLRFTHLSPRSLPTVGWAFSDSLSIGPVEGKASMIGSLSGGDPYEIK
jgi:hypothetical protein